MQALSVSVNIIVQMKWYRFKHGTSYFVSHSAVQVVNIGARLLLVSTNTLLYLHNFLYNQLKKCSNIKYSTWIYCSRVNYIFSRRSILHMLTSEPSTCIYDETGIEDSYIVNPFFSSSPSVWQQNLSIYHKHTSIGDINIINIPGEVTSIS